MKHSATIIVDTGFWFALFTPKDSDHQVAYKKASILDTARVVFPWPVLYETINTRFVKNSPGLMRMDSLLKGPNAVFIEDDSYRRLALRATIHESQAQLRPISLVDMIIRFVIDDPNVRIAAILTFNEGDFADVCRKRNVEML